MDEDLEMMTREQLLADLALLPLLTNEWHPAIGRQAMREQAEPPAEQRPKRPVDCRNRRRFLATSLAAALAQPRAAEAQQAAKVWRIGLLVPGQPPGCGIDSRPAVLVALKNGLRDLGYVEMRNYILVPRCAVREGDEMLNAARDVIGQGVDVVMVGSNELAEALKKATTTVPVVFIAVADPDEGGLVASLARPGGNMTGFSHLTGELTGKRLQLLKDALPRLRRVAALVTEKHRAIEREAARLSLQVQFFIARRPDEIGAAFAAVRAARAEALLVHPHPMFWLERRRIAQFASEIRLPAIFENADFVEAGGLMAYGASLVDMSRRAAGYIDRILRGVKPADLPVEQPTKFELVINLKTAKALGLTIPQTLLLRADQVIE